jgi:hypothetical protein
VIYLLSLLLLLLTRVWSLCRVAAAAPPKKKSKVAEKVTKKVDKKDKKKKIKKTSSDDDSDADSDLGSDAAAEGSDAEPNGSMRQTTRAGHGNRAVHSGRERTAVSVAASLSAVSAPSLFELRAAVRVCARVDFCQRWTLL